jgi:hypothetical protein
MATYTYDLTTTIGQVRLTIGDQPLVQGTTTTAQFSDEELTYMLSATVPANSVTLASIAALENWARQLSTRPKLSLGDYQEDYSAVIKSLQDQATRLRGVIGDEADDVAIAIGAGTCYLRQDTYNGYGEE